MSKIRGNIVGIPNPNPIDELKSEMSEVKIDLVYTKEDVGYISEILKNLDTLFAKKEELTSTENQLRQFVQNVTNNYLGIVEENYTNRQEYDATTSEFESRVSLLEYEKASKSYVDEQIGEALEDDY